MKQDFDTGVKAWLQVLGSFFLYFSSWYECTLLSILNLCLTVSYPGESSTPLECSKRTMSNAFYHTCRRHPLLGLDPFSQPCSW